MTDKSEGLQYGKPDKDDPRKTPAKPEEKKRGSKKNPKDSANKPNKSTKKSSASYLYEEIEYSEFLNSIKDIIVKNKERTKAFLDIEKYFTKSAESYDAPQSARNNARKVLEWKEKYGKECKGMTAVGWARARDLAGNAMLSADTVKRMSQFNRHGSNYEKAKSKPEYKTKPWSIPAVVAWLGWGGTSGIEWAMRTSESILKKKKQ
jgi:hypothetical protein